MKKIVLESGFLAMHAGIGFFVVVVSTLVYLYVLVFREDVIYFDSVVFLNTYWKVIGTAVGAVVVFNFTERYKTTKNLSDAKSRALKAIDIVKPRITKSWTVGTSNLVAEVDFNAIESDLVELGDAIAPLKQQYGLRITEVVRYASFARRLIEKYVGISIPITLDAKEHLELIYVFGLLAAGLDELKIRINKLGNVK